MPVDEGKRGSTMMMRKDELLAIVDSMGPTPDGRTSDLKHYVEQLSLSRIEVGWPEASSVLDIWRHRHDTLGLENAFVGWPEFFDTLENEGGVVGLVGLRDPGHIRYMLILNDRGDRIITFLSKPHGSQA